MHFGVCFAFLTCIHKELEYCKTWTKGNSIVLCVHKAEECNMTWPIAHEENRCTFWTSCTGVSWKCHFLCIMRSFGYSSLTDMRILVGRVLHTGMESKLKMSNFGCFWFSFFQDIWWTKGETMVQEERLCTCFLGTKVHETELCTFWTTQNSLSRELLFNVHNSWVCTQFDHVASTQSFN